MGKHYEHTHVVNAAKTALGRRVLRDQMPKILENPKQLLALKGHATSAISVAVLEDICLLKKPLCRKLQRKNDLLPFEAGGDTHLENLARLNNCSLFALVNSTKKRPDNLVLGRTFGFRVLDMIEFGISNYLPMASFGKNKCAPGAKPLLLFNGDDFEANESTRAVKSLLLDVFRGPDDVTSLNLGGIDRVIVFSLKGESKVQFRQYNIELRKQTDSSLPKTALKEVGPQFDLEVRRSQLAPDSLLKEAMKKPKDPRIGHKTKNVTKDGMGDKMGRIHLGKQDLTGLALARMKGLQKKRGAEDGEADAGDSDSNAEEADVEMEDVPSSPSPEKRRKVEAVDS